jgi:hypothetical protein
MTGVSLPKRDLMLELAGALTILVAILHGAIAETAVFPKARVEPPGTLRLLRLIWQASTIDWIAIGILLIVAPTLGSESARRWIVAAAVLVCLYAATANALATRRVHLGWVLMSLVVALAIAGV